jgi:hypothetical protein
MPKSPVKPKTLAQKRGEWRKLRPFTLVVITWTDAGASASAQYSSPQAMLDEYNPIVRRTTGFWAGMDDRVVIAFTDDDRTLTEKTAAGGPMYIPLAMVSDVNVVAEVKVKGVDA